MKLKELKLPFPVLVLVNEARIGNEDNNSFASISFDTLASLDDDYIFNFYYSTLEQQIQKRNVPESYKLYDTLDINATASKKNRKIGLKIILNSGYSALTWDQLEKFILFGVSNVQIIKNQQQRIKVRYYANGYWVSMLSYDTVKLNTFLGWKNIERPNPIKNADTVNTKKEKSNKNLFLLFFAVLLGFSGIVVLRKKHYR